MSHKSELISSDINAYLEAQQHKSLLRFITCGSVDAGKSSLIGRLLYESKMIFEDQLAALEADSKKVGTRGGELDFALLVDGLAAEREQGITIDVAYRFFSTEKRKFIVADTPGHEQYTRNMGTGASTADLAVILIDARKGIAMFNRVNVPVLGIVENMSYFVCDKCGTRHEIFGHGGARDEAQKLGVPFLGEVPLDREVRLRSDAGEPVTVSLPESLHAAIYRDMASQLWQGLAGPGAARQPPRIIVEN